MVAWSSSSARLSEANFGDVVRGIAGLGKPCVKVCADGANEHGSNCAFTEGALANRKLFPKS